MSLKDRVGRCYELAFNEAGKGEWPTLAHGYLHWGDACIHHAWLERDGLAYDPVMNSIYSIDTYRAMFKVDGVITYPAKEAMLLGLASGHSGPWSPVDYSRLKTLPRGE